jgi:hypothetical protein
MSAWGKRSRGLPRKEARIFSKKGAGSAVVSNHTPRPHLWTFRWERRRHVGPGRRAGGLRDLGGSVSGIAGNGPGKAVPLHLAACMSTGCSPLPPPPRRRPVHVRQWEVERQRGYRAPVQQRRWWRQLCKATVFQVADCYVSLPSSLSGFTMRAAANKERGIFGLFLCVCESLGAAYGGAGRRRGPSDELRLSWRE